MKRVKENNSFINKCIKCVFKIRNSCKNVYVILEMNKIIINL